MVSKYKTCAWTGQGLNASAMMTYKPFEIIFIRIKPAICNKIKTGISNLNIMSVYPSTTMTAIIQHTSTPRPGAHVSDVITGVSAAGNCRSWWQLRPGPWRRRKKLARKKIQLPGYNSPRHCLMFIACANKTVVCISAGNWNFMTFVHGDLEKHREFPF